MVDLSLYAITFEKNLNSLNIGKSVEKAILGGVTAVQYRAKYKTDREMYKEALIVREITKKYGVPFIVDNRLDIAMAVKADGVHVGQDDLPIKVIRSIAGYDFIIGFSTHNIEQVRLANDEGLADYLGFGPIFNTTSKENAEPTTGIENLCRAISTTKIPIVAIGGIKSHNVREALKCKPAGIAISSGIFLGNPYENSRMILKNIKV